MPKTDTLLIGQMLIEQGVITPEQLEAGLNEQKKTGDFICMTLVKLGFSSEERIFTILSQQLKIPYIKLKEVDIKPAVIEKVPAKFATH